MNEIPMIENSNTQAFADISQTRRSAYGHEPDILADIYRQDTNISVWQRGSFSTLSQSVADFLVANPHFERNQTVAANNVQKDVSTLIGSNDFSPLSDDIVQLVDMFCYLFDLKAAGFRMAVLNRAMCPRFHVDNVPCRLVSTYHGEATQWIPHHCTDRSKLGRGNNGLPDDESGLYSHPNDIEQVDCFDVALLKGELWEGNEGFGLVHRSPTVADDQQRLFLSLDFSI